MRPEGSHALCHWRYLPCPFRHVCGSASAFAPFGQRSELAHLYLPAYQLLGAMAAAGVLSGLLPGPLEVNCELSNGTGIAQGLFYGKSVVMGTKHRHFF